MNKSIIRIEKLLVAAFCFWTADRIQFLIDEPSTFEIILMILGLLGNIVVWLIGVIALLMYADDLWNLKETKNKDS